MAHEVLILELLAIDYASKLRVWRRKLPPPVSTGLLSFSLLRLKDAGIPPASVGRIYCE